MQVTTELGERFHLAIKRMVQSKRTGYFFQGLDL
jgi:hypothetical protein